MLLIPTDTVVFKNINDIYKHLDEIDLMFLFWNKCVDLTIGTVWKPV